MAGSGLCTRVCMCVHACVHTCRLDSSGAAPGRTPLGGGGENLLGAVELSSKAQRAPFTQPGG